MQQSTIVSTVYVNHSACLYCDVPSLIARKESSGIVCRLVEMEGKGWGVLADEDIMPRAFVMEYIGLPSPCRLWPIILCA